MKGFKEENDNYFPSVIVVNKRLTNALLLTVNPTRNIEKENPQIYIRHYNFKPLQIRKVNNNIDIVDLLEKINLYYENYKIKESESQKQLMTLG
ncbi:MAG: hypothetical protein HWD58_18780 [Bacteroidota bacterium]|nr:MAG: hypothetical protein HWD58_18780 [Bacteroidota bacterium]